MSRVNSSSRVTAAISAGASAPIRFGLTQAATTRSGALVLMPKSSLWPKYCFPSQIPIVAFPFSSILSCARRIEMRPFARPRSMASRNGRCCPAYPALPVERLESLLLGTGNSSNHGLMSVGPPTLRDAGMEPACSYHTGDPALNPPVNKRVLSTGETGEFASESVGFGLNPWG